MILVDTSVWIDYFRERSTPAVSRLDKAIDNGEDLCTCGLILTEILQGIRSQQQYVRTRTYFSRLLYLPLNQNAYIDAADLYRQAQRKGKTIRKTVDCIIAACALLHRVPLLHADRDFTTLASISPQLQLLP